jgi:serine/threonine protein kinase
MSGFVYKVRVNNQVLIKKEIPSPETIDEFLYEVNALNRLRYSRHVIPFYGVVVDDRYQDVKGLLISFAKEGALIDVIYDRRHATGNQLPWQTRQKWARQIVQGLSDIHEAGFVQGDFTLSNIVIDHLDNAKIIDINRRGCPVGWEPPEATPLIESNQRISMYIGVKSDLYQLGMVLWALATEDDEPESHGRPLTLDPSIDVPNWYRRMMESCLSVDPRDRLHATTLLTLFPNSEEGIESPHLHAPSISVDDGYTLQGSAVDGYVPSVQPRNRNIHPANEWSYGDVTHSYVDPSYGYSQEPYYVPRGRSPPSPLPSDFGRCDSPDRGRSLAAWRERGNIAPSYSDAGVDDLEKSRSATPTTNHESLGVADALDEQPEQGGDSVEDTESTPALDFVNRANAASGGGSVDGDPRQLGHEPIQVDVPKGAKDLVGIASEAEVKQDLTNTLPVAEMEPISRLNLEDKTQHKELHPGITVPNISQSNSAVAASHILAPAAQMAIPSQAIDNAAEDLRHSGASTDATRATVEVIIDGGDLEAREATPRPILPPSNDVLADKLAGSLEGVGGIHEESYDQSMREKTSLDDDLGLSCPPLDTIGEKK